MMITHEFLISQQSSSIPNISGIDMAQGMLVH